MEMISLGALDAKQRKKFTNLVDVLHQERGKKLYFRQLLKLADCMPRDLYSIIWNLRLSLDIDSLAELREGFQQYEIQEPTLEQAIRFVENARQKAVGEEKKQILEYEVVSENTVGKNSHEYIQPPIKDVFAPFEEPLPASFASVYPLTKEQDIREQWAPNSAQAAAIEICRIMTSFDDKQIEEIKKAADALISLARAK